MPKIDIIVPCYNYERYLPDCVDSLLGQSVSDLRVLVINDASTDNSLYVANKLARTDKRITVINHETNKGHIATYNEGIEWAYATYLLLISADDMLAPGALERATTILDANPDLAFAHGDGIEWWDQSSVPPINKVQDHSWTRYEGIEFIREFCRTGRNSICVPSVIVRTSVQKTVGDYRLNLPHSGDIEMFLRFAASGGVAQVKAVQAYKRQHPSNMLSSYYTEIVPDLEQRKAACDSFFEEYADRLPDAAALRSRAEQSLADSAYWMSVQQYVSGNHARARAVMDFATNVAPNLKYRIPIFHLARWPGLYKHIKAAVQTGFRRFF